MNSENSNIRSLYRILLNLKDKINLKRSDKYDALSNLSIYYAWKNIKKSCKINEIKISASTWSEKIELPDGSYSVSDIQDYFKCIIKKNEKLTGNPPIRIYVNKMENRITFRTKTGYYLQISTPKAMKLLGSTESKITKCENGENKPRLEITEVVLVHCNIANNDYKQYLFIINRLVNY